MIFGAVLDENMKEQVKITVIAAGFREAARRQPHQKPSYLPKTWKAGREEEVAWSRNRFRRKRRVLPSMKLSTRKIRPLRTIWTCRRFCAAPRKRRSSVINRAR